MKITKKNIQHSKKRSSKRNEVNSNKIYTKKKQKKTLKIQKGGSKYDYTFEQESDLSGLKELVYDVPKDDLEANEFYKKDVLFDPIDNKICKKYNKYYDGLFNKFNDLIIEDYPDYIKKIFEAFSNNIIYIGMTRLKIPFFTNKNYYDNDKENDRIILSNNFLKKRMNLLWKYFTYHRNFTIPDFLNGQILTIQKWFNFYGDYTPFFIKKFKENIDQNKLDREIKNPMNLICLVFNMYNFFKFNPKIVNELIQKQEDLEKVYNAQESELEEFYKNRFDPIDDKIYQDYYRSSYELFKVLEDKNLAGHTYNITRHVSDLMMEFMSETEIPFFQNGEYYYKEKKTNKVKMLQNPDERMESFMKFFKYETMIGRFSKYYMHDKNITIEKWLKSLKKFPFINKFKKHVTQDNFNNIVNQIDLIYLLFNMYNFFKYNPKIVEALKEEQEVLKKAYGEQGPDESGSFYSSDDSDSDSDESDSDSDESDEPDLSNLKLDFDVNYDTDVKAREFYEEMELQKNLFDPLSDEIYKKYYNKNNKINYETFKTLINDQKDYTSQQDQNIKKIKEKIHKFNTELVEKLKNINEIPFVSEGTYYYKDKNGDVDFEENKAMESGLNMRQNTLIKFFIYEDLNHILNNKVIITREKWFEILENTYFINKFKKYISSEDLKKEITPIDLIYLGFNMYNFLKFNPKIVEDLKAEQEVLKQEYKASQRETESEPEPETDSESDPEPASDPKPASDTEPESEFKPDPEPASDPEPDPEPEPKPEPKPEPQITKFEQPNEHTYDYIKKKNEIIIFNRIINIMDIFNRLANYDIPKKNEKSNHDDDICCISNSQIGTSTRNNPLYKELFKFTKNFVYYIYQFCEKKFDGDYNWRPNDSDFIDNLICRNYIIEPGAIQNMLNSKNVVFKIFKLKNTLKGANKKARDIDEECIFFKSFRSNVNETLIIHDFMKYIDFKENTSNKSTENRDTGVKGIKQMYEESDNYSINPPEFKEEKIKEIKDSNNNDYIKDTARKIAIYFINTLIGKSKKYNLYKPFKYLEENLEEENKAKAESTIYKFTKTIEIIRKKIKKSKTNFE